MTPSVIFENPGLIDIRAVKTFGVNVKETENPFGYFGTGLKYAIAILLRNHCKIVIHRGPETYTFALAETDIRGKTFSIITMNGEELGFTSELGKNWELWQAYRELYCNTMDECGEVYTTSDREMLAEDFTTSIVVSGEAFLNIYHRRREFILQSNPIETVNEVEIHEGSSKGLFYKNIFVGGTSLPTLRTYNILCDVSLTEDRTVKNPWSIRWDIENAILASKNEEIIKQAVTALEVYLESEFNFIHISKEPSSTFMEVLEELIKDPDINLNETARIVFLKYSKKTTKLEPITLTKVQQQQLDTAIKFCSDLKLYTIDEFPIVVTETLGKGALGRAKKGIIYLAVGAFDMGTKMVAITLIEEYIHLKHNYNDMTREIQNHLFNKIISLGEEINGEPL